MHPTYRPDIDGLRAFAVVSVLIFHAFPSLLPGGFVGVDVFFVISGFLISGIIYKEIEVSNFSFSNFYARRVKRIFPALITVLIASYAFGWLYLFTDDFRRLGSHIFRASLFLSNFILWREAGYFDNAAETKPLLHLWSLGIEEQFYIIWPVILWLFWRFRTARIPLLVLLTGGSLGWNFYQSQIDLTHDFYSPLTRFWELSSGACLAYYIGQHRNKPWLAHQLSGLAAAILVASIWLIDSKKAFPGFWAMLPVLGATLLIYAGPKAWCNRVLFSNRVVTWIGSISYPLYLWHWPVLAFARIVEGSTPSAPIRVGAVALSVALAWLTYVYIERPIRFRSTSPLRTPALVLLMALVGYAGLTCKQSGGYPSRPVMSSRLEINSGDIGHDAFHTYYKNSFYPCANPSILNASEKWGDMVRCFQTHKSAHIDLAIIGDSHAEHLLLGIAQALPHLNIAVYPRSELPFVTSSEYKEIFNSLLADHQIKYVLLTAMWAVAPLSEAEHTAFDRDFEATRKLLIEANKQIIIATDTPKFGFDPQRCKYAHPLTGRSGCDESSDAYRKTVESYAPIFENANRADPRNIHLIRVDDLFCDDSSCHMAIDGQMMFRDNNHVNIAGSERLGRAVVSRFPSNPIFTSP